MTIEIVLSPNSMDGEVNELISRKSLTSGVMYVCICKGVVYKLYGLVHLSVN